MSISAQDPQVILAGIRQFGEAADGSDLRDLSAAIDRLTAEREGLRRALERSVTAIDDWLNIYASDMCDEQRVKEAHERVNEYGTLWYIASVQEQNRTALATSAETDADGKGGS